MLTIFLTLILIGLAAALGYQSRRLRAMITAERDTRHHVEWELRRRLNSIEVERDQCVREVIHLRTHQTQFLELLSHEFRTPLHALANYSAFLREDVDAGDQNGAHKQIAAIERHVGKLSRLIEQLEMLAKVNRDKEILKLAPVSISLLLSGKAYTFREIATDRNVVFHWKSTSEELWVRGDENYLRLVAQNLFDNALAASKPGGSIAMQLDAYPGSVKLTLIDDGVGIQPEDLVKLFEPFSKTRGSISDDRDGSGLGLHICRQIVELHGGQIVIQSEGTNAGVCAVVEIPRYIANVSENLA